MTKNVFTIVILIIALAAVGLGYYFLGLKNPTLRGAQVTVGAKTFQVEVASSTLERARGLSGRDGLSEGAGMFFLFGSSSDYGFWMKDMKFPIDIIWINGDKVAGFSENAAPEPGRAVWNLKMYYPPESIDRVLEVNAGDVKKHDIKVGDAVIFRPS